MQRSTFERGRETMLGVIRNVTAAVALAVLAASSAGAVRWAFAVLAVGVLAAMPWEWRRHGSEGTRVPWPSDWRAFALFSGGALVFLSLCALIAHDALGEIVRLGVPAAVAWGAWMAGARQTDRRNREADRLRSDAEQPAPPGRD